MLIRKQISGVLWQWYKWQGYIFISDQVLTSHNNNLSVMEPGQGELGTDLAKLDAVLPSTLFKNGTLPEIVGGKYMTYVQFEYANWVNATDVTTLLESVIPSLGIPYGEAFMFALSLGGLASQYLSQPNSKMKFQGAAFYDGLLTGGTVPINPAAVIANCANILMVADSGDTTVDTNSNSKVFYNDIHNMYPNYPIQLILLPGSAHDTWDAAFVPTNKGPEAFFAFVLKVATLPITPVLIPQPPVVVAPPVVIPAGAIVSGLITILVDGISTNYALIKQ